MQFTFDFSVVIVVELIGTKITQLSGPFIAMIGADRVPNEALEY